MKNVFKTHKELSLAYWNHFVDQEICDTADRHNVYFVTYHLFEDDGWIVKSVQSGDSVCGCDHCYQEYDEVVAWVEGFGPDDE